MKLNGEIIVIAMIQRGILKKMSVISQPERSDNFLLSGTILEREEYETILNNE